jgi:transcriptional regulator with XRE-family HTH domain
MTRLKPTQPITLEEKQALARRLRAERSKHNKSLSDIAQALGITSAYVGQLETSTSKSHPSVEILAGLEDFYNLKEGELFQIVRDKRPTQLERKQPNQNTRLQVINSEQSYQVIEGLIPTILARYISQSREVIDIMDTWIGDGFNLLASPFRNALKRGVKIRMILLQPDRAKQRGEELGQSEFTVLRGSGLAQDNLDTLQQWFTMWKSTWEDEKAEYDRTQDPLSWDDVKDNFQIQLYSTQPPAQYYRFDKVAMIGFYLHILQSRYTPQFAVPLYERIYQNLPDEAESSLGSIFMEEFEHLWNCKVNSEAFEVDKYDLNTGEHISLFRYHKRQTAT